MPYRVSDPAAEPPPAAPAAMAPVPADLPYADLAQAGRNRWWRYLLSFLLIIVFMVILQLVLVGLAFLFDIAGNPLTVDETAPFPTGIDGALAFAFLLLTIATLTPATMLAVVLIHRRPARTLFTARPAFDWRACAASAGITLVAATVLTLIWAAAEPGTISFVFEPHEFFLFLPFVLLLVPLQVLGEEVFFRGYLLQGVGALTRLWAIRLIVPAALFVAVHIPNEEFQTGGWWAAADYAVIALYLGFLVLRGNGLEHAVGLHIGINTAFFTIVRYDVTWVQAPTIFHIGEYDLQIGLLGTILIVAIHYLFFMRRLAESNGSDPSRAEEGPRAGQRR